MPAPASASVAPKSQIVPWSASLRLIAPLAVFKAIVLLMVYWSLVLIPLPFDRSAFEWPAGKPISSELAYRTWDAEHYLYISLNGYHDELQRGFYPLWPAMIYV